MKKILAAISPSLIFPTLVVISLCAASSASVSAQASEAARERVASLTAGVMGSGVHTDYATNDPLFGPGVYVDYRITHWVQIEAEGRWANWNSYYGMKQSNYLIGPRVPVWRFGKFNTFGKVLIGSSKMTFPSGDYYVNGSFTTLAFGGTLEYRVNRRWSIRAADFEYQDWPKFIPQNPGVPNSPTISLQPYSVSVGVGYRIF